MIPVFVNYFIPHIIQFADATSNYGFSEPSLVDQLTWRIIEVILRTAVIPIRSVTHRGENIFFLPDQAKAESLGQPNNL